MPTKEGSPELLPFQEAAAQLMIEDFSSGGSLLADEMGLGKTATTIAALNYLQPPDRPLIVCPASLVENWKREWQTWALENIPSPLIINYEKLKNLQQSYFPVIIFDEAHYLKNIEAQRTQLALELQAKVRYFLTGTPILNRPVEIYTLINALRPGAFGSFIDYTKRYCKGRWHLGEWVAEGATNLEELQELLEQSVMIRRTKESCLTNLPPKKFHTVFVEPNEKTRVKLKQTRETAERYKKDIRNLHARIHRTVGVRNQRPLLSDLSRLQQEANKHLHPARILAAEAKLPSVVDCIVRLRKTNNKQVVVYCVHQKIFKTLKVYFETRKYKIATIAQQDSQAKRQEAVDQFQAGQAGIFLTTIGCASTGITLTAASHLVIAELDWSPGNIRQTEDRIWRIGQTKKCTITTFVLKGSLDEGMLEMLERKGDTIKQVMGG